MGFPLPLSQGFTWSEALTGTLSGVQLQVAPLLKTPLSQGFTVSEALTGILSGVRLQVAPRLP